MIHTIVNAEPGSRQRQSDRSPTNFPANASVVGVRLENEGPNLRTVVLALYISSQIRVLMYLFTDFLRSHNKEFKTLPSLQN